ncbi:MAG: type I methionyl aminopeptidase [Proteobacteria bacterium]|nr:type I methionyl aminopeptidase [SAR86 cluster bacterium]MDA0344395.1 type I methionyl aminopeptidase [Pseudomonadota bacterium]MDA0899415.1 type I methionyl aminopeptidase [Pseudomonadota bacterium]MDA1056272.1 type I methionyl aminopeptidase [Pseudomonadota bacterium]
MSISIKSKKDIEMMKIAGRKAASVLEMLDEHVKPGVTTNQLDEIAYKYITEELKCIPANINYNGYPKTLCTSVNQVVCHGIPSDNKVLKDGDIINIDITVIEDGWHGDTSKMYLVGKVADHAKRLVQVTQECMYAGIKEVKPGAHLGDVGAAIQEHAETNHYSVVRDYCGHGIGQVYHEEPQVLHYGQRNEGLELKEGMCFTIEPMINLGGYQTKLLDDGWTVVTKDGRLSAQWEHTIAVTSSGYEILTLRSEEMS